MKRTEVMNVEPTVMDEGTFLDGLTPAQRRFYLHNDAEQSYLICTQADRIAALEAENSRLRDQLGPALAAQQALEFQVIGWREHACAGGVLARPAGHTASTQWSLRTACLSKRGTR